MNGEIYASERGPDKERKKMNGERGGCGIKRLSEERTMP
jgi:hypothetical protein